LVVLGVNRRVLFWLAVVVGALGCAMWASAAGSQPDPSIKVVPDEARAGETVTVTGKCWGWCDQSPVADEVTITLLDGKIELPDFQEVVVDPDANGSFEQEIELPDDLDEGRYYRLAAESPDAGPASDRLFVGRASSDEEDNRDNDDDGNDSDNEDDGDDEDESDDEDCPAPPLTPEFPAPAGVETQAPVTDGQTSDTGETDDADDCQTAAPPPSAPAGPFVLGESESSDGSDGNSNSDSSAGDEGGDDEDSGDDDGDDDNDDDRKGKRALKNGDGDSDEDDDSGGSGAGTGSGRGGDGAPAGDAPPETVKVAAGPAPEDIRESVPWAMIGVLGALFALGLGATYHVVGRWAPDPADVG
jgi:hypothetical protein